MYNLFITHISKFNFTNILYVPKDPKTNFLTKLMGKFLKKF